MKETTSIFSPNNSTKSDKLFFRILGPHTVSDRVRMVATVLSGKDLALEVRSDLKRKVRS